MTRGGGDRNARWIECNDPRQRQLTPEYVLRPIWLDLGGIGLDPCTEAENPTRAESFYCLANGDDGLALPWNTDRLFVNPPYGRARERWVERVIAASGQRVLLIPAATETALVQSVLGAADQVVFVSPRLTFTLVRPYGGRGIKEQASHGSLIAGFGLALNHTASLGTRMYCVRVAPALAEKSTA